MVLLPVVALLALLAGFRPGCSGSESGPSAEEKAAAEAREEQARQRARENRAIDRILKYTTFFQEGQGKKREVALTFDDGPGEVTPKVLDILRRTNTPATFFNVGVMIPDRKKLVRRQVREGHAMGNHTMDHPQMGDLSAADQVLQLSGQAKAVADAGGPEQRLFRPPYRSFNGSTLELLAERNLLMVLWSVDTGDYSGLGAQEIVRRTLDEIKPGSIVLMHDAGGDRSETAKALPDIIKGLKRRNLTPVTVPRLALDDPPADGQPLPEGMSGS